MYSHLLKALTVLLTFRRYVISDNRITIRYCRVDLEKCQLRCVAISKMKKNLVRFSWTGQRSVSISRSNYWIMHAGSPCTCPWSKHTSRNKRASTTNHSHWCDFLRCREIFDALDCRLLNVINDHVQRRALHFNSSFDLIQNFKQSAYIFMFRTVHFREVKCRNRPKNNILFWNTIFYAFFLILLSFYAKYCRGDETSFDCNNIYFVVLRGIFYELLKISRGASFISTRLLLSFTCFHHTQKFYVSIPNYATYLVCTELIVIRAFDVWITAR